MAACFTFTCSHCGFVVDAWDDGNKYVQDVRGVRHYFYHPDHNELVTFLVELFFRGIEPEVAGGQRASAKVKEDIAAVRRLIIRCALDPLLSIPDAKWYDGWVKNDVTSLLDQGVRFVVGNESDYLCMNCGEECRRDPWRDPVVCDKCGQRKLRLKMRLLKRLCPKCKEGRLEGGEMTGVS